MGLLNYFQNKKNAEKEASPAEKQSSSPSESMKKQLDDLEKMKEGVGLFLADKDWEDCARNAPVQGETTREQVRLALQDYLLFNPAESALGIKTLLVMWPHVKAITLAICKSCRQVKIIAVQDPVEGMDSCEKCGKPVVHHRLVWSKDLVRETREFMKDHDRCTKAVISVQAALGKADDAETDRLLKELERAAAETNHSAAAIEAARLGLAIRLFRAIKGVFNVQHVLVELAKKGSGGTDDAAKTDAAMTALMGIMLLAGFNDVTKIGHEAADAGFPSLAIQAYSFSTEHRAGLLKNNPKHQPMILSQACDLDELGMKLKDNEPARRQEALGFVRKAAELMESLDQMDPGGKEKRAPQLREIREHLRGNW